MQHYPQLGPDFKNLRQVKTGLLKGGLNFGAKGEKRPLLILPGTKKGPPYSSCRFTDALLHHTEQTEKLVHIFPNKKITVH